MPDLWVAWAIIALALAFDFVNGFHDAANSIATIVSTRVLKPHYAVAWRRQRARRSASSVGRSIL